MAKFKPKLSRPHATRAYRKIFLIAVEGEKAEIDYLNMFKKDPTLMLSIKCLNCKNGAEPQNILEQMQKFLAEIEPLKTDEIWLVADKDQWTYEQLFELYQWTQQCESRHFVLSNPKFEYWLLLHFEEGYDILSSADCDAKLKQHIPNLSDEVNANIFTRERIENAIIQAKKRNDPEFEDWPRNTGTTVFRLIESLLAEKSS